MTRPAPPPLAHLLTAALVWLAAVTGAVTTLVNGLPVGDRLGFMAALAPGTGVDAYMTPALVSGRNTASVEVVPFLTRAGGSVAPLPVRLRVWVEAPDGSVVAGTERGAAHVDSVVAVWTAELRSRWAGWVRAEDSVFAARPGLLEALADSAESGARSAAYGAGPALDSARAWAARNPVRVATAFERPGGGADGQPAFDAVVRDARAIAGTPADSARLRAFAVRLLALTAARDTAALWEAFEPKYADEFLWWGGAEGVGEDSVSFMAGTRDRVVMSEAAPFEASDVRLRSWAGGRVWELHRDGADGLFQGSGGGPYREVYVGEGPGGELRVVR